MKKYLILIISFYVVFGGNMAFAGEKSTDVFTTNQKELIRAKIGVKLYSGEETRPAKAYEQVNAEGKFRIYVIPEPDWGYIYVVVADQKTVEQLNDPAQIRISKDDVLMLPSREELYQFDKNSPSVTITIICSAVELPELGILLHTQQCPSSKWVEFEKKLIEQSQIDISEIPEKPWPLAGPVRGDDFLEKLKISSGKSLVVKKYEFNVRK